MLNQFLFFFSPSLVSNIFSFLAFKYNLDCSEISSIASNCRELLRAIAESKLISASAVTPSIMEFFKNPLAAVFALSAEPLLPKLIPEVGMGIEAAVGTGASAMDFLLSDERSRADLARLANSSVC